MHLKNYLILLACLLFFVPAFSQKPPEIKKERKVFEEHGSQRFDDYYWLNNPEDSNVINHLHAENEYVQAYMKHTEPLQDKLYNELVDRIEQKYTSLPVKRNGYWYYTRFDEGMQYPYYARKKGSVDADEKIMLNVPEMAEGYKIFLVRGWKVSPDNEKILYAIDTSGDRRNRIFVKDLGNSSAPGYIINNASGSLAWAKDNRTIFYVLNDHTVRAYKVMRHVMGTDPKNDREVYAERDSTFGVYLTTSKNGDYIFINSNSTLTTESRYINANDPASEAVIIQPRQTGIEYYPTFAEEGIFHIYTNKDAKNFKYVTAPINAPGIKNWKDIIPHNEKALLEGAEFLKDYYVVQTKENGLTQINIYDRRKEQWKKVNFGEAAYSANMSMATDEYDTDSIRYSFTSLITPRTEFYYHLETGEKIQLKQQMVNNYDPSLYVTKRIWITAADGTNVPVSIAYRKDKFKQDGSNPMYIYSYGSYGASSDPFFHSPLVSLMDRGFVFAMAHIRGGQELGREWYENGKLLKKKNTFTDFVDAAQAVVNQKYTSPDRLFAYGVSAGGMLMGAVTNMRPDLFRGIIAEVPWMDVITDMFNTDLPLTTLEYDEWGDPNKKEYYDYMLSWSPLDNVKKAKYPAIFATGGLYDTQVPYFSPAKWVAKVRENNLGNHPVLFHVNMGAGHGGESGRFASQKLTALKYAFILDQLGWNEKTKTFTFKKAF